MSIFLPVIELSSLDGSNGFQINGEVAGDESGVSVSVGDINGDGFDDVIVGAYNADPHGTGSGASYVLFGHAGGFSANVELSSLTGTNGFQISGVAADNSSGRSVASAGDFNGDGFDDFIIGARYASPNGLHSGASYLIFGRASGFAANLDLSALNGSNGFQFNGVAEDDLSGSSVSSAGDINGDGFDDVVIGAPLVGPGSGSAGAGYVVFGRPSGFTTVSKTLSFLDGSNGFRVTSGVTGNIGFSVASAGDVNGDGFDDLLLGAYYTGPSHTGRSYVVFGRPSGFPASLDVAALNGANGFKITGETADGYSGFSVASAGDVNGDGFADLLIGAIGANASYVVFGQASGFAATVTLGTLNGINGFQINGEAGGTAGVAVSSAGDVNGDGFDDLVIADDSAGPNGAYSGAFYVMFGKASGFNANFDLASLDGNNGFQIHGKAAFDSNQGFTLPIFCPSNSFVSSGDINGDGFSDIIIGARFADPSGKDSAGQTYVVFGHKPDEAVTLSGTDSAQTINGSDFGDKLFGLGGADTLVGYAGNDLLNGGTDNDIMKGGGGNDTLSGGNGLDRLTGGAGLDKLNGGADNDRFIYTALNNSGITAATRDQITGFASGDKIDVHLIDARAGIADDQAFALDDNDSFSAGEIRQTVTAGGDLRLDFNVDRDATPEMSILLVNHTTFLTSADFIL